MARRRCWSASPDWPLAGATVLAIKLGNRRAGEARCVRALGGILYPVAVLPPALQALGAILPITHALVVLRGAMLEGSVIVELAGPMAALTLTSAAFLGCGPARVQRCRPARPVRRQPRPVLSR